MAVRRRLLVVWLLYVVAIAVSSYTLVSYITSDPRDSSSTSAREQQQRQQAEATESKHALLLAEQRLAQQCADPLLIAKRLRSSAPSMDIWLVAGQSNAVGDNWRDGLPLPEASAPAGEAILAFTPAGRWAAAQPNIHVGVHNYSQPDSVGPEMSFARMLITEGISRRVGLIPTAKCNTDLATDWKPGTGFYYQHMLQAVTGAMQAAQQGEWEAPTLAGMIWVQGESDALAPAASGSPSKADAYAGNLRDFVTAVRTDLSRYHPCLPIVLGVMSERQVIKQAAGVDSTLWRICSDVWEQPLCFMGAL